MRLRMLGFFLVLFFAFAQLAAKAANNRLPVPTPATSGDEMYASYCAECHGRDGKGLVRVRQPATPDLTTLAKKNSGRFPYALVKDAIRGESHEAAYGGEMPPWGVLFQYVGGGSKAEIEVRISKLTDFLRTLQQK
jgi:mono/diheme cytochrome c family protein